ncbi:MULTISPECIES: PaaI family thioesterase [unclassified Bradyrhizobium]|uniref:PaaI family thioesterase n=1 Tax=unclassified Bradyrhizobium TaxID=2631580 RepID=UPI003D1DFBDB
MNLDQQLLRRLSSGRELPAAVASSALARALQTQLKEIDPKTASVELLFVVGDDFTQAEDVVHGGTVATMLDFAMAYAALMAVDDGLSVATITMNVSCIRSAKPGAYRARGEIERCGRNIVFVRGILSDGEGRLVATAASSLAIVSPRRMTEQAAQRESPTARTV